ncbi:CD248 molecule, endosialin a [Odontesthes bonariensis]|uniref:CD248 molecule, endosialin a n=1 Tax=Odontesthes bonariensis TaxID=219752 RepID=UPI003F58A2B0
MFFQVDGSAALLFTSLVLFGFSAVLNQDLRERDADLRERDADLRERDAVCNADGCFVVYFQPKIFLSSWRACKERGGDLATVKRSEDAATIAALFSTLDLRQSRAKVSVWIGLQRQPRQCAPTRPLRGFSWTTGDQDTDYTNWQREDSPDMCAVPRCVLMGFSAREQGENFKWLDGSCSVPVDGYICHYAYDAMCGALWSEGAGNALYATPFNLLSTLLTHAPFGSVATLSCPSSAEEKQSVVCAQRGDGSVGWSREQPLCPDPSESLSMCEQNNGGCEQLCRPAGVYFSCGCADGYELRDDGRTCERSDVCAGAPCASECLPVSDGYRCACSDGYMLAPDEHNCLDVNECLQSPCEQICENVPGTFECRCRGGYFLDDEGGCEDVDECVNDPCEHACENTPGSHICHCYLGFSLVPEDSKRCQDINECRIPGTCEQMCVNYEGGFECHCKEGYELMSNHYSCQKRGEGDTPPAVTPPFPWITQKTGHVWDPMDYVWTQEQSHTSWTTEEEKAQDWFTDPPRVVMSDVIWVTRAPQGGLSSDPALNPGTPAAERDDAAVRGAEWLEWQQRVQSEGNVLSTHTTTSSSTESNWDEDDEEEATTAVPFLSTSTISEGAWNWWPGPGLSAEHPEEPVTDSDARSDSGYQNEEEEEQLLRSESSQFPPEGSEKFTHSPGATVPTQLSTSQKALGDGGGDPVQKDREQRPSSIWLLVGLLVPLCIFVVVMVALGIVYCTRCGAEPRNQNTTDCYHWISGAHDKQGAPNNSARVKSSV